MAAASGSGRTARRARWTWCAATVVAQSPPLARHLPAMRESLAGALGLPPGSVSVKAKSTDGLGALGRGEGIAALAVALLAARETSE